MIMTTPDTFKEKADISGNTEKMNALIENLNRFTGGSRGDFNIIEP